MAHHDHDNKKFFGVPSRECLFCDSTELTDEHLWGRWLRNHHPPLENGRGEFVDEGSRVLGAASGTHRKRRSGLPISGKLRKVCRECNNNWLNQFNLEMCSLYKRIGHSNIEMDRDAAMRIASYAYTRHLLLNDHWPPYTWDDLRLIGDDITFSEWVEIVRRPAKTFRRDKVLPKIWIFLFPTEPMSERIGTHITYPMHYLSSNNEHKSIHYLESRIMRLGKVTLVVTNSRIAERLTQNYPEAIQIAAQGVPSAFHWPRHVLPVDDVVIELVLRTAFEELPEAPRQLPFGWDPAMGT